VFVSTESREIVQHSTIYSLIAVLRTRTKDGAHVEQEYSLNCADVSELPTLQQFKRIMTQKYHQLMLLKKARRLHAFSGPVLLHPIPAGVLIHEAIGHRLEGSRLLARNEGQTFRGQEGRRVVNHDLTIRDDPGQRSFGNAGCIGSYRYDDEGTQGENTVLVEDGTLRTFLTTRSATGRKGFRPNGHARNRRFQRPISRMAVTIVEAATGLQEKALRAALLDEMKRQKKPFGLVIYETSGGETDTSSYDFQAFSGEISFAALVRPDGTEECIRGVNFVGTPLQALHNIVGVGRDSVLHNGFCGAESGLIPVSTISPALLLNHLELQGKEEDLVTPYLLPPPKRRPTK
jgi:predicted Zn-dependent protease